MSIMKKKIESMLADGNTEEVQKLLEQYEEEFPDDIDLVPMKVSLYLLLNDIDKAAEYALQGVRRMPLSGDMYYNLAYVCEVAGLWLDAYLNYQKAGFLYTYRNDKKEYDLGCEERAADMLENNAEMTAQISNREEYEAENKRLNVLKDMLEKSWGFCDTSFQSCRQIVGKYFEDKHFLAKERSNIAFMFRGGAAEGKGIVEELMSNCDYSCILRKLAGVNLPEVPAEGRFEMADYTYWLEDLEGNRIKNEELCQKYLNIVLKHIAPILIYR